MANKYKKPYFNGRQCLIHPPGKCDMDFDCPSCVLEIICYNLGGLTAIHRDVKDLMRNRKWKM